MEAAIYEMLAPFKQAKVQYGEMNIHQKVNLRSYLRWLIDESPGTNEVVSQHTWRGGRFLEIEEPKRIA